MKDRVCFSYQDIYAAAFFADMKSLHRWSIFSSTLYIRWVINLTTASKGFDRTITIRVISRKTNMNLTLYGIEPSIYISWSPR